MITNIGNRFVFRLQRDNKWTRRQEGSGQDNCPEKRTNLEKRTCLSIWDGANTNRKLGERLVWMLFLVSCLDLFIPRFFYIPWSIDSSLSQEGEYPFWSCEPDRQARLNTRDRFFYNKCRREEGRYRQVRGREKRGKRET
jgi:hypothetical protein